MTLENWQVAVKAKQEEAAAKIPAAWRISTSFTDQISETSSNNVLQVPRECGILSAKQLEITENYDATALLENIHSKHFTAVEVAEAFCIRAAIAQQVTNCLTETFFDQALERARELDEYLQKNGEIIGPLHGLPVSLKDCFNVKGIPSTIGYTEFIKHGPVTSNSAVVQILLDLGAVLYAGDSHNYVFGRTLNPNRSNLTAGGSSGGEGALVAMRGSILGVGTDIAGSIRIPAYCNGTYALRPSEDRIPYGGQTSSSRKGLAGIKAVAGPLATSVRDLELFSRVVINSDPWKYDSSAIFSTWRAVAPKQKLRLGFILEDSHFPVHPPVLNTLTQAVERLKAAGHDIINLEPPSIKKATLLAFRNFAMDPANTAFKHIQASGEPRIPALSSTDLPHDYMPYDYAPLTLEGLYDLLEERGKYKAEFGKIITEKKIDAIIMPGYQGTAPQHDIIGWVPYTVVNNVLNYPAVVIPYRKANKADDAKFLRDVEYRPPSADRHKDIADDVEGAPCCVQVVGRHMQEEELLREVETISKVLAN
ncbi:amidase [Penicillium angulare]|uniref:amidase n=1 Tax=Penicillium angulare TaxID=116970 RepID=UPI00254009D0|nr:amidase [Penicillium angulare]KAJ5279304.1 amidase [Penicillium angulare]